MPLVRVDVPKGNSAEYRRAIGEEIYTAMVDVLNVPKA
jgi:4-oxalocrotonate tautomerase